MQQDFQKFSYVFSEGSTRWNSPYPTTVELLLLALCQHISLKNYNSHC